MLVDTGPIKAVDPILSLACSGSVVALTAVQISVVIIFTPVSASVILPDCAQFALQFGSN